MIGGSVVGGGVVGGTVVGGTVGGVVDGNAVGGSVGGGGAVGIITGPVETSSQVTIAEISPGAGRCHAGERKQAAGH